MPGVHLSVRGGRRQLSPFEADSSVLDHLPFLQEATDEFKMTILGDSQRSNRTFVDPHVGFFSFPPFAENHHGKDSAGGSGDAMAGIGEVSLGSSRSRQRSTTSPTNPKEGSTLSGRSGQGSRGSAVYLPPSPLWTRQEDAGYIHHAQHRHLSKAESVDFAPHQRSRTHFKSSSVNMMPCENSSENAITRQRPHTHTPSSSCLTSPTSSSSASANSDRSIMRFAPSPNSVKQSSKMGGFHSRSDSWQDKQRGLEMVVGLMDDEQVQEKVR